MRVRTLLVLTLSLGMTLGCLTLAACGGGGDDSSSTNQTRVGPFVLALPFAATGAGEGYIVGLKNNAGSPATVYVTAYTPAGVAYVGGTVPFVLAAHAEVRTPLVLITGAVAAGGWSA